jgi:transcriptional regulator of heat shock response
VGTRLPRRLAILPLMDGVPSLTPRQQRLLFAVCRDYVLTGEPASSGRLVKMHGLPWSSATVRQEFAVLERDGLLVRSHHSSGRLPTRSGLERYVASLAGATELPSHLATIVDRGLAAAGHSVNDEVRATSAVLSEVAGCVDVAPLVLPRALVVLGFGDGSTAMRTVSIEALSEDPEAGDRQVRVLQGHLRELCTGRSLDEALARLRSLQQAQQARIDRALAEALRVGLIVCAGASLDPLWLQVAGQGTLAAASVAKGWERCWDCSRTTSGLPRCCASWSLTRTSRTSGPAFVSGCPCPGQPTPCGSRSSGVGCPSAVSQRGARWTRANAPRAWSPCWAATGWITPARFLW